MMRLFSRKRVNIVITNRYVRYADQNLNVYGEVALPKGTVVNGVIEDQETFQKIINQLVRDHKWRRSKAFFAVPDDTVIIRELEIPGSLTEEEALGYVEMQRGKQYFFPFSNPAIDIDFIEKDEEQQKVLIYGYPKDQVMAFKNTFETAGLTPVVADLTGLSVYRYFYHHREVEDEHILLLHWTVDALAITAFTNHKAVFSRYVSYDERLGEIVDTLEMDEGKALELIRDLTIEINRILDFYQYSIMSGESPITGILISGDFPHLDLVKSHLSEALTIPQEAFYDEANKPSLSDKYIDVLGLALKKEE